MANELTDAQIAQMLEAATATPPEGGSELTYRLGTQTFKAKDATELQAQLDAAMQQIATGVQQQMVTLQQQAAAAAKPAAAPAADAVPTFDKETYARMFLEDPMQAQEYLDEHRFGVKQPSRVLSTVIQDVGTMEQSLAVQQFMNSQEDYQATPENFQALSSAMQEFGLPWNYNGLRLAFSHAKANGLVRVDDGGDQQQYQQYQRAQQYAPQGRRGGVPTVPRGQSNAVSVDEDIMGRFESLPAEKMKSFLEQLQYNN